MTLKRVNITIDEHLHKKVQELGLNLSATIRECLEDQFSEHKINISVSEKTRKKYYEILEILSATDEDFEPYLDDALSLFLKDKQKNLQAKIKKYLK